MSIFLQNKGPRASSILNLFITKANSENIVFFSSYLLLNSSSFSSFFYDTIPLFLLFNAVYSSSIEIEASGLFRTKLSRISFYWVSSSYL